ncbi:ABC transporter ATP-binding protein [Amycolatopsis sp. PS_44_ISF1]|uniref:ABC transporter ATP-binding protein n=1 Tax=Amycolatopsis sp. PS_44_ISF1 TaxID=2974917 RepID=UPI0028E01C20|nr:ABC transporter ATP-binding protein [Amycolatopsis sp. PS_44_ISF1]MDT8910417.1 ATP-binding cassette domain-containing protein [Amycolatopsis sp. PS_44_ISF1]
MLRLTGVGKRYGAGGPVLDGVDLSVPAGRVVGILGSNGSGKSTLLRIMAGVSRASSGVVEGRPSVGYLPDRFPGGQRLSARAYLRHMARIRGLADLSTIDPLLRRLALVGGPDAQLRTLSKGNAQKVGLAQAVLPRPELLILDEPWSGLDVGTHAVLGELVAETRARGASVVFTDHRPEVVREHADEVHRLDVGQLTPSAAPAVDGAPGPATRIVLSGPGGDWTGEPGVRHVLAEGTRVVLTVDATSADAVLLRALSGGWSVREVAPCSP